MTDTPTTPASDVTARPTPGAVVAAWLVHVYTATGVALALLIVMAAWDGDTVRALWLGLVALIVDGTDGMLARRLHVKRVVPWFDGAMLDNIVDYLTYAFVPMVLLWSTGYLGNGTSATVLGIIPLMASAYQFCRVDAKTEDHLFLGFPSYWNIVAFYVIAATAAFSRMPIMVPAISGQSRRTMSSEPVLMRAASSATISNSRCTASSGVRLRSGRVQSDTVT